jgi:hypothetical protein
LKEESSVYSWSVVVSAFREGNVLLNRSYIDDEIMAN